MTITPEMEGLLGPLRERLSAENTDLNDSPLWRVVNAYVDRTIVGVEQGRLGIEDIMEARAVCAEYDELRGRARQLHPREDSP